jgi:hypothetical protein
MAEIRAGLSELAHYVIEKLFEGLGTLGPMYAGRGSIVQIVPQLEGHRGYPPQLAGLVQVLRSKHSLNSFGQVRMGVARKFALE